MLPSELTGTRLGREERALLQVAREKVAGRRAGDDESALGNGELDWPKLLRLADHHGLIPLLQASLRGREPACASEGVASDLKARARGIGIRNLQLAGEMASVVSILNGCNVPVVPYKGAVMAHGYYGDLALRPASDVDLLVAERDVRKAKEALLASGFAQEREMTPEEEREYFEGNCELNFNRTGGGAHVELHWGVLPPVYRFHLTAEELIARAMPSNVAGARTLLMTPEDTLLALCGHGCKHRWSRLFWILDVALLLRRDGEGLDWQTVWSRAGARGCERMLMIGLGLARELLGAELPEPTAARVAGDRVARRLRGWIVDWMFGGGSGLPGLLGKQVFQLLSRERIEDQWAWVRRCLGWMFADEGRDEPGGARLARRAVRPLRLLKDYALDPPKARG